MLDDIVGELLDQIILFQGRRQLEGAKPDPGVGHATHHRSRLVLDVAAAASHMAGWALHFI